MKTLLRELSKPLRWGSFKQQAQQALSLSPSIFLSLVLCLFLSPRSTGKPRSPTSDHLKTTRASGDYSEGTDLAGGVSVQRGKSSLASVAECGWAAMERCWSAVSSHTHRQIKLPISSSWPPRHNGTLCSRQKCQDRGHTFSCKTTKLWQLIWAKQRLILR